MPHARTGRSALLFLYFPAFLIVCLGVIVLRHRPADARALYRVALLLTTLPYLLHVWHTWGWVSGFGDPRPRIGIYTGLVLFAASGVLASVGLLALALALVPRAPIATAALPAALWLVYWFGTLRLVYWRAPDFIYVDNKLLIWLFGSSAVATVLLALSAWVALARSPRTGQRSQ